MDVERRNQLLSLVLAVIIIALGYYLYRSIHDPYQEVIEQEQMTERVRERMTSIRDVLIQYESNRDNFPPTEGGLDSVVAYVQTDSLMVAQADSILRGIPADSLIFSPRPPHNRFEYTLNDTLRPQIYLLEDPDSDDRIGSLERTTQLNAASWQ